MKDLTKTETFCLRPFIHVSTTTTGDYKYCCRSAKWGNVETHDLEEAWTGDLYNEIRRQLTHGERPEACNACWRDEDNGLTSLRQSTTLLYEPSVGIYKDVVPRWLRTGTLEFKIPIIELKMSNLCNLRCRMCWPKDSTPWIQDWDKIKQFHDGGTRDHIDRVIKDNNMRVTPIINKFENDTFISQLTTLLYTVDELEFAGGEPLLDPLHFKILGMVPNPEDVIVKYSTNLTQIVFNEKHNILDLWKKFKGVKLTISVDGPRDRNNYIRKGSDWDTILLNAKTVKAALGDRLLAYKISTCISAMNVDVLTDMLKDVIIEFEAYWIVSQVQYPAFLNASVLPVDQLQAAKEKLDAFVIVDHLQDDCTIFRHDSYKRHLDNCKAIVDAAIANNTSDQYYSTFIKYQMALP